MNDRQQRHTRDFPCPVCGGHAELPPGSGKRCWGFTAGDWVRCTREEFAGSAPRDEDSDAWRHKLTGECRCGTTHGADTQPAPTRAPRIIPRARQDGGPPRGRLTHTYDYRDEAGELRYQACRYQKPDGGKTFSQRRPDGRSGWLHSIKGVRRVPYRLPELLAVAPPMMVLVVEGEKDADRLASLGYVATTSAGGAGMRNQWPDLAPHFRDRDVVILPDNDDDGRKYGHAAAAALREVAASVRWAELPGLGQRGDVSDWLDAGHTPAELAAELERAGEVPGGKVAAGGLPSPPASAALDLTGPVGTDVIQQLIDQITHSLQGDRLTDVGNSSRLVADHEGDLHYCYEWESWLVWNGRYWVKDAGNLIVERAKATTEGMLEQSIWLLEKAQEEPDLARQAETIGQARKLEEWARKSEAKARLDAMEALARSVPGVPITTQELNTNHYLLNLQNGTLDLKTGELRPHAREDLLTTELPYAYDPQATCPTWLTFLDRIFAGDTELIQFIRRAVGYTLTGSTVEHRMFMGYGTGKNGKTTFLRVITALLGHMAKQTPFDTLLVPDKGDSHRTRNDIADLHDARCVVASEANEGSRIDEAVIKQLTGGDPITARFLFKNFFTFHPQFKLWVATNHKPLIRGTDNAIWRRLSLIPFTVTIPPEEVDLDLPEKLLAELPGILNWAIAGCLEWQAQKLGEPTAVREATAAYREESDALGRFIADCCVLDRRAEVTAKALHEAYARWANDQGERPLSTQAFGRRLTDRGLQAARTGKGGARTWHGIGLQTDIDPPPEPSFDTIDGFDRFPEGFPSESEAAASHANVNFHVGVHVGEHASHSGGFAENPSNPSNPSSPPVAAICDHDGCARPVRYRLAGAGWCVDHQAHGDFLANMASEGFPPIDGRPRVLTDAAGFWRQCVRTADPAAIAELHQKFTAWLAACDRAVPTGGGS